jgi:WD40 repeat protein
MLHNTARETLLHILAQTTNLILQLHMIRMESCACLIELLLIPSLFNVLQVWTVSSGFCFITFSEHTNAVTAVHFMANNHSLLSASLDGTIRAWDLFRYRNFRTFTTPSPRQFVSLTADQSGEVICAGTLDSFEVCVSCDPFPSTISVQVSCFLDNQNIFMQIFVWSMKTGRLLDVLSGHEGPVHGLMFSPINVRDNALLYFVKFSGFHNYS